MPRKSFLALALAVGICIPAAGAVAAAAAPMAASDPGSIGIRLLEAPAAAEKDPRAQIYIVDHLAPGTVIHRKIEVSNTTASLRRVALYPAAAAIKGGSFLPAAGHTVSELSTWTTVKPASVSLPAGGHSTAEVTIHVPKDASPDERYGVVWAENAGTAPQGGGVTLVNRVGIRLYLSVGPGGAPPASFTVGGLAAQRAEDGSPTVVAEVRNTGGRALDLSGALNLTGGPGGLRAGPFPAKLGVTLAPGDSSAVTILLDRQLPDGPWQAVLKLRSGLLERSVKGTLLFPAEGTAIATVAPHGLPWWIAYVLGGLALIFLFLLVGRRRSTEHEPADTPVPASV